MKDILNECAKLRGVYMVPWRTLHEFEAFVSSSIFGNRRGVIVSDIWKKHTKLAKKKIRNSENEDTLEKFAEQFLEYCKEEYNEH